MAESVPGVLTRCSSEDSSVSSNILLNPSNQLHGEDEDHVPASTPPTSLSGGSTQHSEKDVVEAGPARRRSGRVKALPQPNYNPKPRHVSTADTTRNVSGLTGRTLVNDADESAAENLSPFQDKVNKAMDMGWELTPETSPRRSPRALKRKPSVKEKMKKAAKTVSSVLGKRGRDVMEAGKRTLEKIDQKQSKILKQLDTGKRGVLDEIDLDQDFTAPPKKRAKTTKTPLRDLASAITLPAPLETTTKRMKAWQKEGLYAGQDPDADKTQKGSKRKSKATGEDDSPSKKPFMPLPMFNYLDKTRDFIMPFDVYAPSLKKGDPKPKDWHQLNKNRLIGDAKDLWGKDESHKESSYCFCQPGPAGEAGCDEDCLNRAMQYECNSNNCRLPPDDCGNRHFAELAKRTKKGGAYDIGVEILPTGNRGFGIRSCRSFAPGQIIMEYTGEVITEGECQRRMREEYKDKQCYYLMELERGLVIDGTRGSKARFINHSCMPNCEVRMLKVNDTLRMGVFAGERGVATGEELSYDYNFDNFGTTHQPCYCGAPNCRGYLGPRLNATEKKKQEKEELEARKKAADDARRKAEQAARKRKIKEDRGTGWIGWVAVDDPETKARLRAEKAAREERASSSARAMRLAARRLSEGVAKASPRKVQPNRRRTTMTFSEARTIRKVEQEDEGEEVVVSQIEKTPRVASTSSKSRNNTSGQQDSDAMMQDDDLSLAEPTEDTVSLFASERKTKAPRRKSLLNKTARESKQAMKTVGEAVKNGLKSAGTSSSKLRQSTLSFSKLR